MRYQKIEKIGQMGLSYRKRRCINNCNRRLIEVNQSPATLYSQIKKKAK